MTEAQETEFVRLVNVAIVQLGLSLEEAAALLAGCYAETACQAWGDHKAADQTYLLALQLAKRAGLDAVTEIGKPPLRH